MSKQKAPSLSALAEAIKEASGRAVKASDVEMIALEVKDAAGKSSVVEKAVKKAVLALIRDGMTQATKLEAFWKKNADTIVEEFFGADPFPNMSASDMLSEFRADERLDVMYATFQTRHQEYARAMRLKQTADNNPETDDGKNAKDAYASAIKTIRRTANQQALKVCRYYADSHAAEVAAEQREQPSARQIIEATIAEWANRVTLGRGVFQLAAEKALLNQGIEALRGVLTASTVAAAQAAPTSTLSLSRPTGRAAQAAAQKAGEIVTLTPEQYEEAKANA